MLLQVGVFESSKSAMNTLAPELSALITILRSVGPVISTRRSCRSWGTGATVQSDSRTRLRFREEIRQTACVELDLPRGARRHQFAPAHLELPRELRYERQRLGSQDFGKRRRDLAGDFDARRGGQSDSWEFSCGECGNRAQMPLRIMKYYFALDGAVQYEYYWTESKSSIRRMAGV